MAFQFALSAATWVGIGVFVAGTALLVWVTLRLIGHLRDARASLEESNRRVRAALDDVESAVQSVTERMETVRDHARRRKGRSRGV